ncbi:MAG: hypothetical protein F2918_01775 [Actinobacteria bacterium]|uniref:Unannotated protein n=1 Tax=freshwater metagenome TaxID=449393 RepID=A0A6J6IC12_9ZZZZ|nr:hypothetical protein [Actinomycetota bacterium]MTB21456.1 hypothetical protein [Actinomycetota bacterium]
MKKLFLFALITFFILPAPAHAESREVQITSTVHRNFDGTFRNDELAEEIAVGGRLWSLIFSLDSTPRIWVIDAALIEDITAMTEPYELRDGKKLDSSIEAVAYLSQLKKVTKNAQVVALPFGNPDPELARKLAPSELNYYYKTAQTRLATALGRPVRSEPLAAWSKGQSYFSKNLRDQYAKNRKAIAALSTVVDPSELADIRAQLGRLMSPLLTQTDRTYFSFNATQEVYKYKERLKIYAGKYQLTSARSKLPITLANGFNSVVKVNLDLYAGSSRIRIDSVEDISLEPKSKTQISIPVEIFAPGQVVITAQFVNAQGRVLSESADLSLNLTVIDSRVAWFTTGAAVLLFLAAVTQSVRRIRRARK